MPPIAPPEWGWDRWPQCQGAGIECLGSIAGDVRNENFGRAVRGRYPEPDGPRSVIKEFNLMRVYHDGKIEDARKDLASIRMYPRTARAE